ncbi:MAG TPA: sulfatase-like hydrolase/transferase [Melioribacteraceae bacterium]|nr:sulfatase-like hydrolase/transferase [Melioribacteraceae bacterium]
MRNESFSNSINRRDFIKRSAMAAVAFNIVGCSPRKEKPNLLFIWTDQQRADTMAIYGNKKIEVPNLNKLASQSIVLQNPYVTQPVCTPSRSSVMTGLYPHSNGCLDNNVPLPGNILCTPEIINDPDYRTAYYGKWHLGDELFAQHGFEEWISIEDIYNQHFSEGRNKSLVSDYSNYLKSAGYKPDGDRGEFTRDYASKLPIEHCKPKFLEIKACDFLKRNKNNPFILYVNFLEPHPPFNGPLNDKYDPDYIDLPPNFDDDLEEDEPLRYRMIREKLFNEKYKGEPLRTAQDWRKMKSKYWGLVSQVDLSIGAILKNVEDLGLAENTIVIFTSDHGEMMGAHKLLNKTVMYEEAVKVPWLMKFPHLNSKHQFVKGRFGHIDLLPTILDTMDCRHKLQGESLMPVLNGSSKPLKDVFIEWNNKDRDDELNTRIKSVTESEIQNAKNAFIRTVITQDGWKLCWADKDKSQLFDLNQDPYETTNLFYKPDYSEKVVQLKEKIRNWQHETKDELKMV